MINVGYFIPQIVYLFNNKSILDILFQTSLLFHVSATHQRLLELAEEQNIRKKDLKGLLRDFTVIEKSEFGSGSDILSTAEKAYLVRHELENIRALENEKTVPGYPKIHLYEGQSICK